ncbi:hypothetical protein OM076_37650 [Solirubrobacter ginsenosidimutans]|uniref:Uncharacterized protein n=1 Tax=Solirubrobacter ginsenosidimutans TaxID=490573 RepID=A0A9X3S7H5_9ACTN|nr:hypothetical protein [Solirubrobacter ginsenosidimutans]MDA0166051.1 hypothetical protein [Solirubrobacter ginsenosidimutans]
MSAQLSAAPRRDQTVAPARRRARIALAVAGVIAAIAAGGLVAGEVLLPDHSGPAQDSPYVPSEQALRSLSNTVAAEYRIGLAPTDGANVAPDEGVLRELRHSIANQYRSR